MSQDDVHEAATPQQDTSAPKQRRGKGKSIPEPRLPASDPFRDLPKYYHPDEIAARSKTALKPTPGVEVTGDAWDRHLMARMDPDEFKAPNYFDEAAAAHAEEGFANRWLNPDVIKQKGWRGWEPVYDEDGSHVTVAGQILGRMPADKARRKLLHNAAMANARTQQRKDAMAETAAQIGSEVGGGAFRSLRSDEAEELTGLR